jgi:hypothetical protein
MGAMAAMPFLHAEIWLNIDKIQVSVVDYSLFR